MEYLVESIGAICCSVFAMRHCHAFDFASGRLRLDTPILGHDRCEPRPARPPRSVDAGAFCGTQDLVNYGSGPCAAALARVRELHTGECTTFQLLRYMAPLQVRV